MIANITQIKELANIVDVIESFIPLRKAGANFQATCPFHNEKSASFIISPTKQIFTCFGCGKSGDVFKFVQEFSNLSFTESVEEVAKICNIEVIYTKGDTKAIDKKPLYQKYATFFALALQELHSQPKICQYLFNRGLNEADLEYFSLGFMPQKEQILSIFTNEEALSLGLLKLSQTRQSYTPFKERVIFAIRNNAHQIVGLSGRIQPYHNFAKAPKYINSTESQLFKKSENLYLYSYAKSHIKSKQEAIICEGYFDAITLHKIGFKNAVATCGTAFNLCHINQIYKIDKNVSFGLFFDNDEAGAKAQIRAIDLLLQHKIYNIHCYVLKESKDIAEILEKGNLSPTIKKIPALKFYIHYHFKHFKTPKEKDTLLLKLKSIIQNEPNYYQKEALIRQISAFTGINEDFFTQQKMQKSQISSNEVRFFCFVNAIYNDEDCAYIAKNSDLHFLPKALNQDVQSFFTTGEIPQSAHHIAFNEKFMIHNVDSFYKELLSLQIHALNSQILSAKLKKDIKSLSALTSHIQEIQKELQSQMQMPF